MSGISLQKKISQLSLKTKIYLSLGLILIPVFSITIFIQTQATRPLLQEEARQIGISVCRLLSSEILANHLLSKPDLLEARLIEMTWQQPSIIRIDVFIKNPSEKNATTTTIASNVVDLDENSLNPINLESIHFSPNDTPVSELKEDDNRNYWEILYPIKDGHHTAAYIRAEISLQLMRTVVQLFSKIALAGALISFALLISLLSYFLRRMIENESKLKNAQLENIELTSQLHETQRELFLNEKLAIMGQLTASFAHEIGTPLNSLSGHFQLLQNEISSDNNRIQVIQSQLDRIASIVKEFLTSTHMPSQQKQLVEVPEVVERIIKLIQPRLSSLKIQAKIIVDSNQKIESLRIVPTEIEQILLNLCNNAIDSLVLSKNTRELNIEIKIIPASNKPKSLQIIVSDTGEGIAPDDLKNVLKPFFTTKARGQGTGLGLTICQRLVKKYGGFIDLQSTLGKGTQITVTLPYA